MDGTVEHDREARAPSSTTVVLAGGDPVTVDDLGVVPAGAFVIAADSGVDVAAVLGMRVDLAVGDFDSASPEGLAAVEAAGAEVVRHPRAKDATDLELALDAAVARGAAEVLVLGGHGGRLDHFLANAALLAAPAYARVRMVARMGPAQVTVVRPGPPVTLAGEPGSLVSLVPVHGPATGVVTRGLRFPLACEALEAGSTRGVSNELLGPGATVSLADGVLLAVQPDPTDHRKEGSAP